MTSTGQGEAFDAVVSTEPTDEPDETAVDRLRRKVAKCEANLADARQALAEAEG